MHSVYCIENPLMDYVMNEDYSWLGSFGAKPGTMQLVPFDKFKSLLAKAQSHHVFPGGSGANTIRALALLLGPEAQKYGRPAYSGAVGRDDAGRHFASVLRGMNIDLSLAEKELPTGVSGIVVTHDHERTMFTYLGACQEFSPQDISWELLNSSKYFYTTGYMWDTEPQLAALKQAVDAANSNGIPCCLDLADPFVVDRYYKELREWIKGRFSVVFGNRAELSRMTDCTGRDEEILSRASDLAPMVVMKVGSHGCVILNDGLTITVPGEPVEARDTTGAGDAFAAGFLYGLLTERDLEVCGRIANRVASRVVQVEGCRVDLLSREELLKDF